MTLRSHRFQTTLICLACVTGGLLGSQAALCAVTQPDGMVVPINQALSKDYFDTRYRQDTLGLQSMLDLWEDPGKINAYEEGSATNVVFSPLCGLNGSMILRGGACQVDFGWYCTDDAVGKEVIHPLVTAADVVTYHDVTLATLPGKPPPPPNTWAEYKNNDKGFVPTIQMGKIQPVKSSAQLGDVRNSADYKACPSGKIGFGFKGNPTSICPMSKFSEPHRNQISNYDGKPWINVVVYQSKKNAGVFYMAFEDMPTSPSSFVPTLGSVQSAFPQMTNVNAGWQNWQNDGDFNDFVYKVEGILCVGGGKPCTPTKPDGTPWQGACSLGVTACSTDSSQATGACQQRVQPTTETCNGWDDDCDGVADNGDNLCPTGYVCDNGKCIGGCGSPEFPCTDTGTVCQREGRLAGYCVEQACLNVECPTGQRCLGGTCVGGCESRVCPAGMECIAGNCIDLCAGVQCPSSFVCERGACIPDCKCLPCTDPAKSYCNTDGRCIDQQCAGVTCEQYKTCVAGSCVDPCASQPCGAGVACTATADGKATCPSTPTGAGGTSSTDIVIGNGSTPVTPGSGSTPGAYGGASTTMFNSAPDSGCVCRMVGAPNHRGTAALAALGLALGAVRLGRRRSRRSSQV